MSDEFINYSYIEMLIQDLEENSLDYWDATQDEMAKSLRHLQQENKQLKEENKRLEENNLSMQEEMVRTWEKIDLYKEVIEEVREDIVFCINGMKNEFACTDSRTNRELHTMVKILEEGLRKIDKTKVEDERPN